MSGHYHVSPYRAGSGVEHGLTSSCPFCLARSDRHPPVGQSIFFLSGADIGQHGVVVEGNAALTAYGNFCAKMDFMPEGHLRTVNPSLELFIDPANMVVPEWMPPLSIDDACALHEQVLESLQIPPQGPPRKAAAQVTGGIVAQCWGRRLPLNGEETWKVLEAHGAPSSLRAASIEFFDFGQALLVATHGRPPIKRKRMSPLSNGRYHTKKGRDLWVRILGHD